MTFLLGLLSALLTLGYLYVIGIFRTQILRKTKSFTLEYSKGMVSLCICALSLLVYFAVNKYSYDLFLLNAFVVGGLIYGSLMLLLMIYLIVLKKILKKQYDKTLEFIKKHQSWL